MLIEKEIEFLRSLVDVGSRVIMMEAVQQSTIDRKKWRALVHMWVIEIDAMVLLSSCVF